MSLAQTMYRYEMRLRTGFLGEPAKHIRPLSEAKCTYGALTGLAPCQSWNALGLTGILRAIENGANILAEGFLFSVTLVFILGGTWLSSHSQSKQRSGVKSP